MYFVTDFVTHMIDTINLILTTDKAGGVDFLTDIPPRLAEVGVHEYEHGYYYTGHLGCLNIKTTETCLQIKGGSLCKWHLGDNFKVMGRKDIAAAIENLSDELHSPMAAAKVTRLDFAANMIMKYPPDVYFPHLGQLTYSKRLAQPNGIYYDQSGGRLCFYDKVAEQRARNEPIPELYQRKNVLRYEQRHTSRIDKKFKDDVTFARIAEEDFYIKACKGWLNAYLCIQKINDIRINFEIMNSKRNMELGLMHMGLEAFGGQAAVMEQISEAQKRGNITRKQAYDFRQKVKNLCSLKSPFIMQNDAIVELDAKIKQAVAYCR